MESIILAYCFCVISVVLTQRLSPLAMGSSLNVNLTESIVIILVENAASGIVSSIAGEFVALLEQVGRSKSRLNKEIKMIFVFMLSLKDVWFCFINKTFGLIK